MRLLWLWAVINLVLTFLPVWDVAFNGPTMVAGLLPLTILWSYLVFTSNLALAIVFYYAWARDWAAEADGKQRFAFRGERPGPRTTGEER